MLEHALNYLKRGWSVIPLCPRNHVGVGKTHNKSCKSPGKSPWIKWKDFQDRLPTEKEVKSWWGSAGNCQSNVGMATGPVSGLIGIDVDGAAGETRLQVVSAGDLPATLEFSTPSGGRRLLYRIPDGVKLKTTAKACGRDHEEVRLLAYGSQTVMPPSLHANGGRYEWKHGPEEIEPADAPKWLIDSLRAESKPAPAAVTAVNDTPDDELLERARSAVNGDKFRRLFDTGDTGDYNNDDSAADQALCNLLAFWSGPDAERIDRLFRKSKLYRDKWEREDYRQRTIAKALEGRTEYYSDDISNKQAYDDPRRLIQSFPGTWRTWNGRFYKYVGTHYSLIPDDDLTAALTTHIQSEFDRTHTWMERRAKEDPEFTCPKHALYVKPNKVREVELHFKAQTNVPATVRLNSMLDGKPGQWLALRNGLLDISTGNLLPHTSEWFSTVCLPYPYDPAGKCPIFDAIVERAFDGDAGRIELLWEWLGYCFHPNHCRKKFLFMTGTGDNGKSVVITVLRCLVGADNYQGINLETLHHPFSLFPTLGKLVAAAADCRDLDKVDEGVVKKMTGGDSHEHQQKYKDPITAVSTAKLIAAANELPPIGDRSGAVWNRMIILPFTGKIPPAEQKEKYLNDEFWVQSGELPGILSQALARYRSSERFPEPQACKDAKAEHRLESHSEEAFFDECTAIDPNCHTPKDIMYSAFHDWAVRYGYRPLAYRRFCRQVKRWLLSQGVDDWEERPRLGGESRPRFYKGIKLLSD